MWLRCDAMRCNAMIYGRRSEKKKKTMDKRGKKK
jgi:hypothetical protein